MEQRGNFSSRKEHLFIGVQMDSLAAGLRVTDNYRKHLRGEKRKRKMKKSVLKVNDYISDRSFFGIQLISY